MAETTPIRLIVGLGNPGEKYAGTRHNAGFHFIDALAGRYRGIFRPEKRFFGDACRVDIGPQQCHLLKPMTFMNRSGQSVAAMATFYKIAPGEILVAHDELDIPAGQARFKSIRRVNDAHQIEEVGAKLRAMMPWIKDKALVDKSRN